MLPNFWLLRPDSACRYLLHMEGYSYSSRLKYLMACGSAVLYPNKRYTEFW
jgi:hypothetical protein